ncbi:putative non-specific serine/threonine protein kinase [Helianthus debilis subsp. tardiflorus]
MLEGVIPSSLGNCHHLLALYLNDNKLNEKIPIQLLQLSSLSITLDLSQNNLFGSLPIEVGNLNMLTTLNLSDNNFSGNIPSSLGGCSSLLRLSLKGNLFQGMIPLSLNSLKGLVELDISHNNFSGIFLDFF